MLSVSPRGLDLIKQFEGCHLDAYQDPVGVWTVGYGHTGPDVDKRTTWTQVQADNQLGYDVSTVSIRVRQLITSQVSQSQFDALVSFAYNLGVGALSTSTLLKLVNGGEEWAAALEFTKWVHAGDEILPGLIRRRLAEANLFVEGLG